MGSNIRALLCLHVIQLRNRGLQPSRHEGSCRLAQGSETFAELAGWGMGCRSPGSIISGVKVGRTFPLPELD